MVAPSGEALQNVDGLLLVFPDPDILALQTTTLATRFRTINVFISVSAGLRSEIASVTWEDREVNLSANRLYTGIANVHPVFIGLFG